MDFGDSNKGVLYMCMYVYIFVYIYINTIYTEILIKLCRIYANIYHLYLRKFYMLVYIYTIYTLFEYTHNISFVLALIIIKADHIIITIII
jgi:hypothetical protein